ARNDTAVTFTRDGNLFLASLDPRDAGAALVQLTDIGPPASSTPRATVAQSSSQQIARDEELNLIEHLKRQQEVGKADESARSQARSVDTIPQFLLGPQQTVSALQLSGDAAFGRHGAARKADGEP